MAKKMKIRTLKPRIKEIKPEEGTLEEDIEKADEEIFNDLDSTSSGNGEADALGASQARVSLGDIAESAPPSSSAMAQNPNEEMSFNEYTKQDLDWGTQEKLLIAQMQFHLVQL